MKINEVPSDRVIKSAILEEWMSDDLSEIVKSGGVIFEMANLKAKITDLPANIVLWTRPQPNELPHNKYRIKVTKDHKHPISYSISSQPEIVEKYNVGKKYNLDAYEHKEIVRFIQQFYPLLISYVDAKITDDELEYEIQKINKEK
jgi:hypothetical protein